MSKLSVSVLIIAQNAAYSLRRCLDSLTAFDEVVLVDGGSRDATLEIAKEYPNVKVYQNPWPGFIAQRNFSIDQASHPWCFMMDADEAVTPEVVEEIARVIASSEAKKLYRIVRTEYFEGEAIEFAYGRSDYQERLFQTKHIRYTGGNHHEHLIDGRLAKPGDSEMGDFNPKLRILHWPHYGIDDWIKKLPRFIVLVAEEKIERGKRASAFVVLATLFGTFFQVYAKSWRQGKVGFVISVSEACYRTLVKINMYTKKNVRKDRSKSNFEQQYLN
tara:strand:- start:15526 stop:16347 length:822 start_codon:yes stop_codon:yes gene_type:complete